MSSNDKKCIVYNTFLYGEGGGGGLQNWSKTYDVSGDICNNRSTFWAKVLVAKNSNLEDCAGRKVWNSF